MKPERRTPQLLSVLFPSLSTDILWKAGAVSRVRSASQKPRALDIAPAFQQDPPARKAKGRSSEPKPRNGGFTAADTQTPDPVGISLLRAKNGLDNGVHFIEKFPEIVVQAKSVLVRFMDALSCIDQCFIADRLLEQLPAPSQVGKTKVGGIDLNKPRMRWVVEAVIAMSPSPNGFTASDLARQVRALSKQRESAYGARRAAYDLKKLRGKKIVRRIGQTRRYESVATGLKAMTALVVLRNKAIKPLLAAAQDLRPARGAQNPGALDRYYDSIRLAMRGVFQELGLAA